ncbi:amidase [Chthonobacter albigriseus]|uniref:amidase n=1 Tax=Chthonobacter albigriseus TaxID=1683161 RepID=UPI0019D57225|nr:amidase [Chthonobacter albigriseus]
MTSMSDEEIRGLDIAAVATAVRGGRLTPSAVAEAHLARISEREKDVQAFAFLDPDRARQEAISNKAAGPLAGVTFGVKDVIDTADMPTGYGSAAYEGFRPRWDAPIVALARAFGGTVLGKTVSTEFAMSSPGKTRNPHNLAHTPGGSSSGSCVAVAAGMVHVAFGTQTSGSIIRPASYCGVVGYKPSFGTLNRTAVKVLSDSLDTIGVVTRTVGDAATVVAALAENPALAKGSAPANLRIGVFATSRWAEAEPATRQALDRAAAAAQAGGAKVRPAEVPDWFEDLYAGHDAVMGWETPRSLAYERKVLTDKLAAETRRFLDVLARTTRAEYDAALEALVDRASLLDSLLGDADVLITPAAPGEAPAGLQATGNPVFNKVWTLLHGPCITVPTGVGPGGLPVGVQVVGRLGRDAETLAAAAFLERALHGATS